MFSIERESPRQEIDGFGVCLAFHQTGMLQKHPKCREVLDLLFDTAGASILRNIVGDGGVWGNESNGPTPTIEPEEGVWQYEGDEEQVWAARGFRTSETEDLAEIEPVTLENQRLKTTLPPKSVTTWLMEL